MADLAMGFALTLLTTVRTKALLRIVASSKANARLANGRMSALPPRADMCSATRDVRFVPEADINDMSGAAAIAGERGVSLSAGLPQRWRHNTGSDCRSHDCLPKYCLYGSSLRTSHTGSPNTRYLCPSVSWRTKGPHKPEPDVDQRSYRQEQRWQQKSGGSSSISVLDAGDNTETAVSIRCVALN